MKAITTIILLAIVIILIIATSCSKYCEPGNIRSGKSSQHHDSRPFKASIRIMRATQYGPFCKVRYGNMKYVIDRLYENCDCAKFQIGVWVAQDSI